jgi:hypothetical protein
MRSDKFAVFIFLEFSKPDWAGHCGKSNLKSQRKETEFYSSFRNQIISFHLACQPDSVLDPGGRDSI